MTMDKPERMQRPWLNRMQPKGETRPMERQRSDDLYHTSRWTKLSASLRRSPAFAYCAECAKKGIYTPATVVDHIVPWPVCEDFFDVNNLQPLCEKCNHAKGQRDKQIIQKHRKERG
jgi:5-methylcytosine-specific restriction endonuclease McrA